ncbi:MAG: M14 metallopeptidase family protein [Ginsengibacter sp.]
MKKINFLLLSLFLISSISFAQIKSPEEFLGYKIGARFTPHYQVVNYFQHIAQAAPGNVKMVKYGETNELRPLYLSFISTAENISNLEEIRLNNLRLANLAPDKRTPSENTPAIIWLSYNVHGNEASSTEAAMLTLYSLIDPNNKEAKDWLKNTVIIIDPCLNPDGRDRYVNWYNSIVGKHFNPELNSREHQEPWPGGRSNHYNFDLNRDWAWQTQTESKARIKQYNQWLPQVHVDFHEQGINAPYYFAPAAEPFHEVITPWQRDFQKMIVKNNAKYFDKNNWLYFTNEVFDLFYPSYGDTYPLYNGSIGMTYEQAGSGAAGLGVITAEKDTLTLYDRALHHFTSGMATIETASLNSTKLIQEFRKFFNEGISGNIGDYKTYIIKNEEGKEEQIRSLISLLENNGIQYGTGSGSGKGYRYLTQKEESFQIGANDLLISAAQPRSAFIKVLFEPQSKLSDSVTYDITAWAMPYAFGLNSYATKQKINVNNGKVFKDFEKNDPADAYAYVIKWQGVSSAGTVARLLNKGIKMRYSESDFSIGDQSFKRGSVIILRKGNEHLGNTLWQTVAVECNAHKITMYPVATGMVTKGFDFGSSMVRAMKPVKVAMLTGEGVSSLAAGQVWDFFDNTLEYPITLINNNHFAKTDWNNIDVLIMPDGRYDFLNDKDIAAAFEQWIRKGGKVIALERAMAQLSKQTWSNLKSKSDSTSKKDVKKDPYEYLKSYQDRERESISGNIPGAIYKVDVDNTHPLMFGYSNYYYSLKLEDAVYEFMKNGWNVGVIKKESLLSGYVGHKLKTKLEDSVIFGVQDLGKGTVTYLADDVLFRNFWETGKLILCNAVFLVGQ